ncbi:hypothetical protein R69746_08893 [Paraburkholderia aspalathi]|nr:hypothetical protein R69746_08893 [Paraburkholderia aspalathi]
MTSQPGRYRLVPDKLDILMTRPGQGHDEEPCLMDLAGKRIGHQWPRAEINLCRLSWLEFQTKRNVGRLQSVEMKQETVDRRVAAGISVVAHKRGVDRRALDAGGTPLGDLRSPRL